MLDPPCPGAGMQDADSEAYLPEGLVGKGLVKGLDVRVYLCRDRADGKGIRS